jgi:hypothetical protein
MIKSEMRLFLFIILVMRVVNGDLGRKRIGELET